MAFPFTSLSEQIAYRRGDVQSKPRVCDLPNADAVKKVLEKVTSDSTWEKLPETYRTERMEYVYDILLERLIQESVEAVRKELGLPEWVPPEPTPKATKKKTTTKKKTK